MTGPRQHYALLHGLLPGAGAAPTDNHPGNGVLAEVAGRVLAAAGLPGTVADPGRTLLDSVDTPVLPEVLDDLGITGGPGFTRDDRLVRVHRVADGEVRAAHPRWYAEHPGVAEARLARHAEAAAAPAA